jgi:pyruvate formate lyase activating enzyme
MGSLKQAQTVQADSGSAATNVEEAQVAGMVSSVRRLAIHDGPGIRTIIFLKGCPLCCLWCAAPETQSSDREVVFSPERCLACDRCRAVCPVAAIRVDADGRRSLDRAVCTLCGACVEACYTEALTISGERRTVAEVVAKCVRDRVFYEHSGGGVTLSGGEPLAQPAFTAALLRALKGAGLHTAMETSGFAPWEVLDRSLVDLDLLLYDLKILDAEAHRRWTGVPNEPILANLQRVIARGFPTIIRVPVIAGLTDGIVHIRALGRFLADTGPVQRVDLLPYHRLGEGMYPRLGRAYGLRDVPLVPEDTLNALAMDLRTHGFAVQIGG